jgi:hypothetical protein
MECFAPELLVALPRLVHRRFAVVEVVVAVAQTQQSQKSKMCTQV